MHLKNTCILLYDALLWCTYTLNLQLEIDILEDRDLLCWGVVRFGILLCHSAQCCISSKGLLTAFSHLVSHAYTHDPTQESMTEVALWLAKSHAS